MTDSEALSRLLQKQVIEIVNTAVKERNDAEYQLNLITATVKNRIGQHETNLSLWESGYLAPTEPDPEERRVVMIQLKAAIFELKLILAALS